MGKALSTEVKHLQIINDAYDLAAEQIKEGKASSQVLTFFLKYGAEFTRNQVELEKLQAETRLAEAKVEAIRESQTQSELLAKVIKSMARYRGSEEPTDAEIGVMLSNEDIY